MQTEANINVVPKKWKVYKILTIILSVITVLCVVLISIGFLDENDFAAPLIIIFLTYFISSALFIFHFISLQLILLHYPNEPISNIKLTILGIVSIVAVLFCIFLLFTIFSGFNDFTNIKNTNTKWGYFIFLIFIIVNFLLLVYSIIFTQKIKNCITKNALDEQNKAIELIGSKS